MKEYILVNYVETREVIIDETPSGYNTGDVIELEAGTHTISLKIDEPFTPPELDVNPSGTTPIAPHIIYFTKE